MASSQYSRFDTYYVANKPHRKSDFLKIYNDIITQRKRFIIYHNKARIIYFSSIIIPFKLNTNQY